MCPTILDACLCVGNALDMSHMPSERGVYGFRLQQIFVNVEYFSCVAMCLVAMI